MKTVTADQLKTLAPNIREVYKQAFQNANAVLAKYGINSTGLRLSHFMAQILHESGALTVFKENLNYSAKRMTQVWPKRFPTIASAQPYAHKPRELANKVYNGRMGNKAGSDDGWIYIGRGLIQLTGRESYERFGKQLGIDLLKDPDLAFSPKWALEIAAAEWEEKSCNTKADEDSVIKVTLAINGGKVGLSQREEWLKRTKHEWL